jgi:S-DNA-T family DNA segregation ATPase FtsK/SpoIIIE
VRLKLTFRSPGQDDRDLVATIDPGTTIGDLASYLARSDPRRSASPDDPGQPTTPIIPRSPAALGTARPTVVPRAGEGDLTVAVLKPFSQELDAGSTVPESGLRSGVTISLTRRSESFVDVGRPIAVATIVAGPDMGTKVALPRGTAYVGRAHGCEIQVTDSSVSRRHAKLLIAELPAVPEVVDLGSANGILVGGTEVPRVLLKAGDRVCLGDTEVEVRMLEKAPGAAGDEGAAAAFEVTPHRPAVRRPRA